MEGNVKIDGVVATITIKPEAYPLPVVRTAAYSMLDEAYFFLDCESDGKETKKILVELRDKNDGNIAALADKFLDRLLNYSVYADKAAENRKIRETILTAVLLSAQQPPARAMEENAGFLDDPLGIAKPWTPSEAESANETMNETPQPG